MSKLSLKHMMSTMCGYQLLLIIIRTDICDSDTASSTSAPTPATHTNETSLMPTTSSSSFEEEYTESYESRDVSYIVQLIITVIATCCMLLIALGCYKHYKDKKKSETDTNQLVAASHPDTQIEVFEEDQDASQGSADLDSDDVVLSGMTTGGPAGESAQQLRLTDVNPIILSQVLSAYLNDNEDDALPFKLATKERAQDTALPKARLVRVARDVYGVPTDKSVVFSVSPTVAVLGDAQRVLMCGRITAKARDEAVGVATIADAVAVPVLSLPSMTTPRLEDCNAQFENDGQWLGNISESESSRSSLCESPCLPDTHSAGICTNAPKISVRMTLSEDASVLVAQQLLQELLQGDVAPREVLDFICVSFCCRVVSQGSEMQTECEDECFVVVRVSEV